MKQLMIAAVVIGFMVTPAFAGPDRCLQLVKQFNDEAILSFDVEVASRPDVATISARGAAVEAEALHNGDKHDQAVAKLQEAFTLLGFALPQK